MKIIVLLLLLLSSLFTRETQQNPPDLSSEEALHLVVEGLKRNLGLVNGFTSTEYDRIDDWNCDNTSFEKNGIPYDYLCPNTTMSSLISYLEGDFTPQYVYQFIIDLGIIENEGKLASPPWGACGCLKWDEAKLMTHERTSSKTIMYTFDVPDLGNEYSMNKVYFEYVTSMGWRLQKRPNP